MNNEKRSEYFTRDGIMGLLSDDCGHSGETLSLAIN